MSGTSGATTLIARLEKELRELWTQPDDPGAPQKTRVCTMNLEVIASSRELLERYVPVVDEVTASLQARVIMASIEPDSNVHEMEGAASAVCAIEGGRSICSERITLWATGHACARTASAVESFLVPEIPTALVWLGRVRVDDPTFETLACDAQRLIVDSMHSSLASVFEVAEWARKQVNPPALSDMAWTRLSPWLEMIARFFDGPLTRPLSSNVTRLCLTQASENGSALGPEPALLLGWMATRLDWTVTRHGGTLGFERPDGERLTVELHAVGIRKGVAPQTLASVTLEAEQSGKKMTGSIERELGTGQGSGELHATADADVMVWNLTTPDQTSLEQQVRLGTNKAAKWLERTLYRPKHDPAFDESVAYATHFVDDRLST